MVNIATQLVGLTDSAGGTAPSPSQCFSLQPCHRFRAFTQSSKAVSHDWQARPLVQHGNVDDSVYVFPPAFQRNSKPQEIETVKMSTTRPNVATTSGDVLLASAAWKSVIDIALAAPAEVTMWHPPQQEEEEVDASYSAALDLYEFPPQVSVVPKIVMQMIQHQYLLGSLTTCGPPVWDTCSDSVREQQSQVAYPACGYARPSANLMEVLPTDLLQRADETAWSMEYPAGNKDGCLPR